ncbi:MAG: YhcH/YjgK/YiaL family protein [Phycisphaerae bacterium]|nr:YhcH/YjgK/YiaL family protein [Phycisphaerae bacterium]
MVLDIIKNYTHYEKMSPLIARALKIAAQTDFEKLQDGKYEVDSDKLFYIVQRYKTKPATDKIEAHRKYIDIQLIVKGSEQIGYEPIYQLKTHTPYNEEKEVEFFFADGNITFLNMTKGSFAIFWPSDAHMPGCQMNESQEVLKIVFKIRI